MNGLLELQRRFFARNIFMTGLLTFLTLSMAHADSTVKFHGTLIAASCSAGAVDVNFGEVSVDTIKAASNTATRSVITPRAEGASSTMFNVELTCRGDVTDGVQYQMKGTVADFNTLALATDTTGLGVIVSSLDTSGDATSVVPNTWYDFKAAAGSHQMLAILVRNPTTKFAGGDFSATATLAIQIP